MRESSVGVVATEATASASLIVPKMEETVAKETASNDTCVDNTPVMVVLSAFIVALMVPFGVLISKIKNLNKAAEGNEMQNFDSTQSK